MLTRQLEHVKGPDGVRIAYWTLGSGERPLVYLSGGPWSHVELWEVEDCQRWYERLSADRMLIGYDLRGTGTAQPVGLDEALQLADATGSDRDWAAGFIEWSAERGDAGEIRGFFALSLNDHPHKLNVYGNQLSAWCAQDTLFLFPALGEPAEITSRDPESGRRITVISSDGSRVTKVEPDSTVVSIVLAKDEPGNVFEIWSIFCEHIHFFESESTARSFLSKRKGEFYWLTGKEAMTFGDAFF